MSLSPNEKYPGATEADPNYKDGKFKDNNPSTTNNGSPLKAIDRNEQLALQEAVMDAAGFEYNGTVDTPENSQMFAAYKAALSNGANLLSNHNFLTSSPDDSQPAPSATPTSYPPGYEIFSGVFANETTGILNLTYIDGRVSFSGGDFYMAVPNTGALENITEFVASVADFDGKPRTRGVSYALVGDEYRVTVGVDALEDESANETLLGSVKFEQGSVATGHDAGSLSVGNLSDYTDIVYKASDGNSAIENMLENSNVGDICTCENGSNLKRLESNGVILDFKPISVSINDFSVGNISPEQFKQAFDYCNEKKITPKLTSDLKVVGSGRVEVMVGFDLNGHTLDVEEWDGGFDLVRTEQKVTYNAASSVVQSLISAGVMTGNYFEGWEDTQEVNDSFVVIKTTQPFYSYNGQLVERIEFNKSVRNGVMESPLKYDLDPSLITEVDVYPMEKVKTVFGGGSIYFGSRDFDGNFIYRSTSLNTVKGVRFILDDVVLANSNPVTIFDEWFCQLRLEDIYFQWGVETTATTGYTYHMQYQNGYNWKATKVQGMGDGWGVTGGSIVQRLSFDDCDISRIDAHHPFREEMKVTNSRIGDFGILVCGIGDLILKGNKHLRRDGSPSGKSSGYIRLRSEANGFVDGDLIIEGDSYEMNSEVNQYLIQSFASASLADTTGSPINFACFNSIITENLSNNYRGSLNLFPVIESSSAGVKTPSYISHRNCKDGNFDLSSNMTDYIPSGSVSEDSYSPFVAEPNLTIELDSVKIPPNKKITLTDLKDNNFCIKLSLSSVMGSSENMPVSIQTKFFGRVDSYNSELESVDFVSSGNPTKGIVVNILGGTIKHLKRVSNFIINGYQKGTTEVNISNCGVSFDDFSDLNANVLSLANLDNNSYTSQSSQVTDRQLDLQTPSSGNVGLISGISESNRFIAKFTDNTMHEFILPPVGSAISVVKSKSIESLITRTQTALSLSGDEVPVRIMVK